MATQMEKIDLKSIDKSKWKSYRFEQIADKISENVDPGQTDLTTYVGLEHLDAEDIHIRRKGSPSDVSGGKLRCYPGDVIFGKRRAYQRKAAIVDFEGICSAHSFVLRARPKVIDPKLFPFFLHSDQFMHRMVDISVGGLSPTINWGDLKHQEFLLPPKEQQAQLAELLWAMDEVIEKERTVLEKNKSVRYLYFNNVIRRGINYNEKPLKHKSIKYPETWEPKYLKNLLISSRNGISETQNTKSEGIKVTRIETISEGVVDKNKIGFVNAKKDYSNYKLEVGDILFSHINSVAHIGKVAIYDKDYNLFHGVNLLRLVANPKLIRFKFLFFHLQNRDAKYFFERRAKQAVNQASIDQYDLGSLPLALPTLEIQDKVIETMEQFDSTINCNHTKIASSKALQKSLINQIF